MVADLKSTIKVAFAASLLLSAALVIVPLSLPAFAIAPIIMLNWVAFMLVQFTYSRRSKVVDLSYGESVAWDRMSKISLLAFSGAGFIALALGAKIV